MASPEIARNLSGLVRALVQQGLLSESDIVSLHIPETPETRGLIDAGAIARMKKGAEPRSRALVTLSPGGKGQRGL